VSRVVVTIDGGVATAPVRICTSVPPPGPVAVTETEYGPATVGVPPITPVVGLRVRPAGNDPAVTANVIGPVPVAVTVSE
jgi:hypothetical protein